MVDLILLPFYFCSCMLQMARWDEIISLPVQNPPTLEISVAYLVWSKVEGWHDKIDRVALA